MKYLWFDIECSNCRNAVGKICEFGYVLTDNKFNVMQKRNIFINPESFFDLGPKRSRGGIKLSKSHSFYNKQPNFVHFYDEIKSLLTTPDCLAFAYSASNDIGFLCSTFKRYGLANFPFIVYDAQRIASKYLKYKKKCPALDDMVQSLCPVDSNLVAHEACNDSYMMMDVVHNIIRNEKKTLKNYMSDIQGLTYDSIKTYDKMIHADYVYHLKKDISIPRYADASNKKYIKKKYFIHKDCWESEEELLVLLELLRKRKLYQMHSYEESDYVVYNTKSAKKNIKSHTKWPRKFKFIKLKKFLAQ